jgi:site-specific DNA-methyltransferase (adenine-specific)
MNSSKQDDMILEPFGGSGTAMIACEQLQRDCYMIELDEKYCEVICRRWEKLSGKKAVKLKTFNPVYENPQ